MDEDLADYSLTQLLRAWWQAKCERRALLRNPPPLAPSMSEIVNTTMANIDRSNHDFWKSNALLKQLEINDAQ